jgi:hypothetical protein
MSSNPLDDPAWAAHIETERLEYEAMAELDRRVAVQKQIDRSVPKISKREARRIHALLAPRPFVVSTSGGFFSGRTFHKK